MIVLFYAVECPIEKPFVKGGGRWLLIIWAVIAHMGLIIQLGYNQYWKIEVLSWKSAARSRWQVAPRSLSWFWKMLELQQVHNSKAH
jgi:hypothetical protein